MKGRHLRRARIRPGLQFAVLIIAFALFGTGIGILASGARDVVRLSAPTAESATTTTLINSSAIVPETTTTTSTTAPAKSPPLSLVKPRHVTERSHSVDVTVPSQATTTTTEAPKTPLEVAQSQVGKTGPYADGGFWCAQFVSWVAEQAKIENLQQSDSPARLHKIAMDEGRLVAEPFPGVMVFIDLSGQNFANQYISHVGIVESVNGDEFVSIEGNADDSGLVTRQTRKVGDGYVIAFAEFEKAA